MVDPPRDSDRRSAPVDGTRVEPRGSVPGTPPGTPRWVKLLALGGIVAAVLVVVVMVGAGGQHGPGMHMPGGGPPAGTSPSADAGQTATPGPGGKASVSPVGGPASADEADRTVEVTALDAMAFEPPAIAVSAGETVTFVVTNAGQAVHEFTLGDAAMQQEHADAMAHMPDGMAHDLPNSIALQPGETKQLTWRFGASGTLEYACHEPGHYEAGMRGRLTVG